MTYPFLGKLVFFILRKLVEVIRVAPVILNLFQDLLLPSGHSELISGSPFAFRSVSVVELPIRHKKRADGKNPRLLLYAKYI